MGANLSSPSSSAAEKIAQPSTLSMALESLQTVIERHPPPPPSPDENSPRKGYRQERKEKRGEERRKVKSNLNEQRKRDALSPAIISSQSRANHNRSRNKRSDSLLSDVLKLKLKKSDRQADNLELVPNGVESRGQQRQW